MLHQLIPACSWKCFNIHEILWGSIREVMSTPHICLTGRVGGKQINGYVRSSNGTEACEDLICWNYPLVLSRMRAVRLAQTGTELIYLPACKMVCLI